MNNVTRELIELKKIVQTNKADANKSKKLQSLQQEKEYFQEEALHYRDLYKKQIEVVKLNKLSKEECHDESLVLKQVLLNAKTKEKALKVQLEE